MSRLPAPSLALRLAIAPAAMAILFVIAPLPIGFCASREFLGIACPGCGVTRSVAALCRGDLSSAIEASLAGPSVIAFFLVQATLAFGAALGVASAPVLLRFAHLNDRTLFVALLLSWLTRLI